jgi:hypothetical protein
MPSAAITLCRGVEMTFWLPHMEAGLGKAEGALQGKAGQPQSANGGQAAHNLHA